MCAASPTDTPPSAQLTASSGFGTTSDSTIAITASFDSPVTGLTVDDFNGGVPFPVIPGVTRTLTGGPNEWVLTVDIQSDPRVPVDLSFEFAEGAGSADPPVAAAGPFTIRYVSSVHAPAAGVGVA